MILCSLIHDLADIYAVNHGQIEPLKTSGSRRRWRAGIRNPQFDMNVEKFFSWSFPAEISQKLPPQLIGEIPPC